MSGRAVLVAVVILVLAALAAAYLRTRPPAEEKLPASSPASYDLPQVYASSTQGFSLRLPQGYTADESYRYQGLGSGEEIYGIRFAIPEAAAASTNLGPDTYLSVEEIPRIEDCTAGLFLDRAPARAVSDGNTLYSVASSTGAAAGNRYEEMVYALPGTNPCIAVRYFIHYGVIENYLPGAVREFNKEALLGEFDAVRRTLRIVQ